MTKYDVLLSKTARRQLDSLPPKLKDRVRASLIQLKDDPFRARPKADIKKIAGPNRMYYRIRIGNHRAIYAVEDKKVLVAKILPRDIAYNWLD